MKKYLGKLLRAGFIVAIGFLFLKMVDYGEMANLFSHANISFFALTVLVCVLDKVFMGSKWNLLLSAFKIKLPFWVPIAAYLRAKVFFLFTPSGLGTDIYKCYYLKNFGCGLIPTVSSILVERFIGAFSSLAVVSLLIYFPLKKFEVQKLTLITCLGVLTFFALSVLLIVLVANSEKLKPLNFPEFVPKSIGSKFNESILALSRMRAYRINIIFYYLCSIIEKMFYGTAIYFAAKSLNIFNLDYFYIVSSTPFVALLERLPITISSVGLREGLFVVLLRPYFKEPTKPLAIGMALRLAEIFVIFLSLSLWMKGPRKPNLKREVRSVNTEIEGLRKAATPKRPLIESIRL